MDFTLYRFPARLAAVGRGRPLIAFGLGLLSACGFAPLGFWPLAILALAALIWLLQGCERPRAAFASGWFFGFGHMFVGLHWIAQAFQYQAAMPAWLGWVAVLLLSMLMACYPAVAIALAWRTGPGLLPRVLALAAAWMLTEWLRGLLFSGFPWNQLGVIWLPWGAVAQGAALVGALGLSALTILVAGAIALLGSRERGARLAIAGIAALLVAAIIGGELRLRSAPDGSGPRIHLVQANIGQDEKWVEAAAERHLRLYLGLTRRALRQYGPGVVVWPEAAIPNLLEEEADTRAILASMLSPRDMLLTGGLKIIRDEHGDAIAARNSLFAIDTDGQIAGRYDKAHLVPFGEYLPFRSLLEQIGLSRLAPGVLDFWPGPGARTLHLPGVPAVGPLICYEIIFPSRVVDRSDRPAWLLNVSNDAWFGTSGPYQHLAQARLRAIEEGLPVARATSTGISAMIDTRGRLLSSLALGKAGIVSAPLPAPTAPTPFARAGHILPLLFGLLLLAGAVLARRRQLNI